MAFLPKDPRFSPFSTPENKNRASRRLINRLRPTFATMLVNGIPQEDGTVKALTVKQVADLLGHSTTQVTEMYYVKRDSTKLNGITNEFNL